MLNITEEIGENLENLEEKERGVVTFLATQVSTQQNSLTHINQHDKQTQTSSALSTPPQLIHHSFYTQNRECTRGRPRGHNYGASNINASHYGSVSTQPDGGRAYHRNIRVGNQAKCHPYRLSQFTHRSFYTQNRECTQNGSRGHNYDTRINIHTSQYGDIIREPDGGRAHHGNIRFANQANFHPYNNLHFLPLHRASWDPAQRGLPNQLYPAPESACTCNFRMNTPRQYGNISKQPDHHTRYHLNIGNGGYACSGTRLTDRSNASIRKSTKQHLRNMIINRQNEKELFTRTQQPILPGTELRHPSYESVSLNPTSFLYSK